MLKPQVQLLKNLLSEICNPILLTNGGKYRIIELIFTIVKRKKKK